MTRLSTASRIVLFAALSLAHQVFYPDFYGGVFSLCPDGVDFRYHQIVNIYKDPNAYYIEHGWMKEVRVKQLSIPRHLYIVSRRGARLPHTAAEFMRLLKKT